MRICSLLPSATEIVFALGLGDSLVGVTHECDFPSQAKDKSTVVISRIDSEKLSSHEVDEEVSRYICEGKSIYLVDKEAFREADPDLLITQELCEVCAVSGEEVVNAVDLLDRRPDTISLEPSTLGEILETVHQVGEATGKRNKAEEVVENLRSRIETVRSLFANERDRPRVFCMEWLEPPFAAGHWVPEMVEIAGGECGFGKAGEHSFKVSWEEILDYAPQFLFIMPCGFNIERTLEEIDSVTSHRHWNKLPATSRGQVYLVDANSYFSRPGPRVVDGLEILARTLHPERRKFEVKPDSVLNLRNYMHIGSRLGLI